MRFQALRTKPIMLMINGLSLPEQPRLDFLGCLLHADGWQIGILGYSGRLPAKSKLRASGIALHVPPTPHRSTQGQRLGQGYCGKLLTHKEIISKRSDGLAEKASGHSNGWTSGTKTGTVAYESGG
jgi:hypothetical protein